MRRFLAALLCLAALPADAAVIRVPSAEAPTIQAGLALAQPADTVEISCGEYYEHELALPPGVTLRSEGGHFACVSIDAQGLGRVMTCTDADASTVIEGITFADGDVGVDFGGGLLCMNAAPRIILCEFSSCSAGGGNAVALLDGSDASLEQCSFIFNQADGSGGALKIGDSAPVISGCSFRGNATWDGGAAFVNNHSQPLFENCLFIDNQAEFWGGGLAATGDDCLVMVSGCTFVGNGAGWDGGAIWAAADAHFVVENSILAFSSEGGGIHIYEDANQDSHVDLACCDVFGNAGGDFTGEMADVTGLDGNISAHPLFCNASGGDLWLAADSPCLPANNDCGVQMGAFAQGCDVATGLETPMPGFALTLAAAPNPFNPETRFHFTLERATAVSLTVHGVDGRRVATLLDGALRPAGEQSLDWDATGLAAGCYLARLDAEGRIATMRLILLK